MERHQSSIPTSVAISATRSASWAVDWSIPERSGSRKWKKSEARTHHSGMATRSSFEVTTKYARTNARTHRLRSGRSSPSVSSVLSVFARCVDWSVENRSRVSVSCDWIHLSWRLAPICVKILFSENFVLFFRSRGTAAGGMTLNYHGAVLTSLGQCIRVDSKASMRNGTWFKSPESSSKKKNNGFMLVPIFSALRW